MTMTEGEKGTVSDYEAITAALMALPGVAEAAVGPDDSGGLGMLRLALDPGVDEVSVAGTVGRLLREQFGIGVDADQVELIEDATADQSAEAARPAIARMQLVSSGLDVTATVSLSFHGGTVTGENAGTATQSGVQRAVAAATLRAVEQLLKGRARFEIEYVDVTGVASDRTALVTLTMLSSTGSDRLSGSAVVREDPRQAVIRAVLDAVNRRIGPLLAA